MNSPVVKQARKAFTKHEHATQFQSYDDVLASDSREVPDFVRHAGAGDVGPVQIPARWYLDRQVHELEIEHIWKRKWQIACRTDDIPEVGDTYVYDIAGLSFVIVRVTPAQIKGYWNACLHRGVTLRKCSGRVDRLQCPFHGFTWGLDGRSRLIPNPEEFPHIDPENFSLPEVQVGVWEDFVFINPDLEAESLESYLGTFPDQFRRWGYAGRQQALHFAKVFPANWKAVQEAFMEAWHVLTTHPQLAWSNAERCAQFGASGNYSRGILCMGQSSDYMPRTPDEQEIWDKMNSIWDDQERPPEQLLPEGVSARQAMAARNRDIFRPLMGDIVDEMSDAENVDVFYWSLFPNFNPFQGFKSPFIYRFLPYGDDHSKSIMDVMFLTPVAPGQQPLPPAKLRWIDEGDDYTALQELGTFGAFLSQDIANMDEIMKGLRNNRTGIVNFAREQELKIRHFYAIYERTLGLSAAEEVAALGAGRAG